MIALFATVLFGGIFLGLWLFETDRRYRHSARVAKDLYRHAVLARDASARIQEAVATMEITPDFMPILEMMLRHDRDTVDYCDRSYRRWRDNIPQRLWARYGVPED